MLEGEVMIFNIYFINNLKRSKLLSMCLISTFAEESVLSNKKNEHVAMKRFSIRRYIT